MGKIAQIKFEYTHCSQCPFCKIERQYTPDSFEEEYNLTCKQTGKIVYKYLDWYEIRTMHHSAKPEYDHTRDVIPDSCPFAQ